VDQSMWGQRLSSAGGTSIDWYSPQGVDPSAWMEVRPFVASATEQLNLEPGSASSLRTIRILAQVAAWARGEGIPLDREVVLDPATVERFVSVGLADGPSRATYRSVLRRVAPLLTNRAGWEPRPESVGRRQVAVPYNERETASLWADAASQRTPARCRAGGALMALGCGVGLDGRWVAKVQAEDVVETAWGVLVRVGEPSPRVVPVLASWEDHVLQLAATAGSEFLVGGHSMSKNRASALASTLVVGHGRPKFSASRMRSTWLVTHLAVGTRLPELARAAGLAGVTVLSDLLEFVAPLGEHDAAVALRGKA
jgi:hypothetical protein